jgi:dienelactone hydrolase
MPEAASVALTNPALPGDVPFDTIIYAAAGLVYPAPLSQYAIYSTPDPAYITPRINIAAFANLGGSATWPFASSAVPLNGHVCVPQGRGPFPLVVFAHGNHQPVENSSPGYLYLCRLLASHGIIAATIDVNFLNGGNFGENDGRAIVHLEHLKQFRTWNNTAGHPLQGRVDLNRIMIVGHSRGGEAVGHASFFNRLSSIQPDSTSPVVPLDGSGPAPLGPYRFNLNAVAAIAPTDGQYQPLTGLTVVPNPYYVIHGARDGDVTSFPGYHTYNRAHAVDLANPTVSSGQWKAMLWVYNANHNQFNSIWASEAAAMPRASQEQIAKVHFGALAQAVLLRRPEYFAVLEDHAVATGWVPAGTEFVSQYQGPDRFFVQHHQEGAAPPVVSLPAQGTVFADSVTATRALTALVPGVTTTLTLRLAWSASGGRLLVRVDPATVPAERYKVLSLRVGQSVDAANPANRDQDFTLEVSSGSRTLAIAASSIHRLLYPAATIGGQKIMMQTLRLPVQRLIEEGVDPTDLRAISFVFDRRPAGVVFVGDLQFST